MSNHQTLSYQPTDVLQAEYALNWWNCYANPQNSKNVPWLTTLSWVDFYQNNGYGRGFGSSDWRGMPAPDFKYFKNLMKLVPIGVADGSLSNIFPTNRELELWLIRSIGAEQLAIQQGVASQGEFSTYLKPSKVKQNGLGIAEQVLEMARTSPTLAKAAIAKLKRGEAVSGIVAQPAMRTIVDSGARANQLQRAMEPVRVDDVIGRRWTGFDECPPNAICKAESSDLPNVVLQYVAFSVSAFVMFAILTR